MPKTSLLQTNFSGGEISPNLYGRTDVAKYASGVAVMENFHPLVQGGAVTRDGTQYLGQELGDGRILPFVYARGEAWAVILTNLKLQVWSVSGGIATPAPIDTPYDLSILWGVSYEQAGDTMFLFHASVPTQRLRRLSNSSWVLEVVPWVTAPYAEQGFASTIDLTLSAATVGTGRTVTAAGPVFLASDVGRDIEADTGIATITGYTSSTVVTATITAAFTDVLLEDWQMTDSPQAFVFTQTIDPAGTTTTVHAALPRQATISLSDKDEGDANTITASPGVFVAGDTGKTLYTDSGYVVLTYVSATECTGTNAASFLRNTYQPGAWGITGDAFRTSDVGSYIRMNDGLLKINAFGSATSVEAEIRVPPSAAVSSPPGAWSLETEAFSAANGYPRTGALHEQRLWLSGATDEPQTVRASRIGEYLDFEAGLEDADGLVYELSMRQRNPVLHLVSGERLFAFTTGIEASLRGGNEKAIGPTNIQKRNESSFGASEVRPVPAGREILFVQGGGKKVRALGYSANYDGFDSPDRTVFSDHITGDGVVDMAYQADRSLLYCVRTDGQMAVAAYDVAQEVVAWSRYVTSGFYRSVCVLPNATSDDVWILVNRPTPAGTSRYFVERFVSGRATDSSTYQGDFGGPATSLSGLDRFNGQALSVVADDTYRGSLTPSGGAITLSNPATRYIEAGLAFTGTLELLPPDLGGQMQGSNVSVHQVVLRLLDTATIEINGTQSDFRRFGTGLLDQPPPGLTGDYREVKLTDNLYRDELVIRQPLPFKAHIQAVIRKVTANDV